MILYGNASAVAGDIEDWYTSLERAERVLAEILRDEPEFEAESVVTHSGRFACSAEAATHDEGSAGLN